MMARRIIVTTKTLACSCWRGVVFIIKPSFHFVAKNDLCGLYTFSRQGRAENRSRTSPRHVDQFAFVRIGEAGSVRGPIKCDVGCRKLRHTIVQREAKPIALSQKCSRGG